MVEAFVLAALVAPVDCFVKTDPAVVPVDLFVRLDCCFVDSDPDLVYLPYSDPAYYPTLPHLIVFST